MKKIIFTESELNFLIKNVINENLILESNRRGLNLDNLERTYAHYNRLESSGTFNEIFKYEIENNIYPMNTFKNGCATKVSLALNSAGQSLNPTFRVSNGPFKGKYVQTSAKGLKDELMQKWGQPDVFIKKVESLKQVQDKIGPGKSGVYVCTPCGFKTCTGHASIWSWKLNGNKGGPMDGTTYPEVKGGTIYFWQVGETVTNLYGWDVNKDKMLKTMNQSNPPLNTPRF
jgi:hypothetical protein